jgi:hypothetical protein
VARDVTIATANGFKKEAMPKPVRISAAIIIDAFQEK